MKLKSRPDDFQVEELSNVSPGNTGSYGYYRLSKKSLGTQEAIQRVCRAFRIDARRVRYGGLKDRHAETVQYLTIEDGPERHFHDALIQFKYLGRVEEPYGPQSFSGNRFGITMRDIKPTALDATIAVIEELKHGLIANYFDDQRFGSVGSDQRFVARALIDGDEELALKLAISSFYEHERSAEKKARAALRQHWGDWQKLVPLMPNGLLHEVVLHLAQTPTGFRSAFARIPFFLRNMYLSAYQSHLWNRMLAHWIDNHLPSDQKCLVQQKHGTLPMPRDLSEDQLASFQQMEIPLPSSRVVLQPHDPIKPSIDAVLLEEKLSLSDIRLKHFREPFFSKGNRRSFFIPGELRYEAGWDKLNKGHRKLKLIFTLPRGSYATMLIKRIDCQPTC